MIRDREYFDLTVCNPPFHDSPESAQAGSIRKVTNLTQKKTNQPVLNFGGQNAELWCEGGELAFIQQMIQESRHFAQSCYWFSTLVSKQSNLKDLYAALEKAGVTDHKTLPMAQGNKISRVLAWTFLNPKQQAAWQTLRWGK
jgi:23S rRNA (adenine1618-N6)-methyltransferase